MAKKNMKATFNAIQRKRKTSDYEQYVYTASQKSYIRRAKDE